MARAAIGLALLAILLSAFTLWYYFGGGEALLTPENRPQAAALTLEPEAPSPALREKLARPARLKVEQLPLSTILTQLAAEHDLPIAADALALSEKFRAEQLRTTPVSVDVGPIPLHSLLQVVLEQVDGELTAEPRGERVEITLTPQNAPASPFAPRLEGRAYRLPPGLLTDREQQDLVVAIERIWLEPPSQAVAPHQSVARIPGGLYVLATDETQRQIASLLAGMVRLAEAPTAEPLSVSPWDDAPHQAIVRAYCRPIGPLRAGNLAELIAVLRRDFHLPIAIDRAALANLGLSPQASIVLPSWSAPIDTLVALAWFPGKEPCRLALRYHHETLWVQAEHFDRDRRLTRLYPLAPVKAGISRESAWHNDAPWERLIRDLLDPSGQQVPAADVHVVGSLLIVHGPLVHHRQVERLLEMLKQSVAFGPALPRAGQPPAWEAAAAALRRPITIAFRDLPLRAALRRLGEQVDMPIWLDEVTLRKQDVATDALVTCDVRDVPLADAARGLLPATGLDLGVVEGALVFPGEAGEHVLAVYPVGSLVDRDLGSTSLPELDSACHALCGDLEPYVRFRPPPMVWMGCAREPFLLVRQWPERQALISTVLRQLRARRDSPSVDQPVEVYPPPRDGLADLSPAWSQPIEVCYESRPLQACLRELTQRTNLPIGLTGLAQDAPNVPTQEVSLCLPPTPAVDVVRALAAATGLRAERHGDAVWLRPDYADYSTLAYRLPIDSRVVLYPVPAGVLAAPLPAMERTDREGDSSLETRHAVRLADWADTAGLSVVALGNDLLVVGNDEEQRRFVALQQAYERIVGGEATLRLSQLGSHEDARDATVEQLLDESSEYDVAEPEPLLPLLIRLAQIHRLPLVIDREAQPMTHEVQLWAPVGLIWKLPLRDLLTQLTRPQGLTWRVRHGRVHIAAIDYDEFVAQVVPFAPFRTHFLPAANTAGSTAPGLHVPGWAQSLLLERLSYHRCQDTLLVYGPQAAHAELASVFDEGESANRELSPATRAVEARIGAALKQPTPFDKGDQPLTEFARRLAAKAAINVVVDDVVSDVDEPPERMDVGKIRLTVRARNLPLEVVLRESLSPHGLTYFTSRGCLVIAASPIHERALVTRAYRWPKRWNAAADDPPDAPAIAAHLLAKALLGAAGVAEVWQLSRSAPNGRNWVVRASATTQGRLRQLMERLNAAQPGDAWDRVGPGLSGQDLADDGFWNALVADLGPEVDDVERAFLCECLVAHREAIPEAKWQALQAIFAGLDRQRAPCSHAALVRLMQFCPIGREGLAAILARDLEQLSEPDRRRALILALGRFAPYSTPALAKLLPPKLPLGGESAARALALTEFRALLAALAAGQRRAQGAIPALVKTCLDEDAEISPYLDLVHYTLVAIDTRREDFPQQFRIQAGGDIDLHVRATWIQSWLKAEPGPDGAYEPLEPPDGWFKAEEATQDSPARNQVDPHDPFAVLP